MSRFFLFVAAGLTFLTQAARACDLCAIYSAADARGESGSGIIAGVSELYVPFHSLQFEGEDVENTPGDYINSSITHVFGSYNISERFGVSLNLPVVYREFQLSSIRYNAARVPVRSVEQSSISGLGDLALVGRWTALQHRTMKYGIAVTVLGGVKFPTGDTDRVRDEVEQSRAFATLVGPGFEHDPLGHSISGVHEHMLSPGSGSFDGITGLTINANWERWFINSQFQYYIRTEGESEFRFGNELMISGGPGGYLFLNENWAVSLQATTYYENMARAEIDGKLSNNTGMTAWYFGPLLNATFGSHIAGNLGIDVPLKISSRGLQNVPDYRIHGGLSWKF